MSENTQVARRDPRKELQTTLVKYSDKIAVFGVRPEAYIEAALMACVKNADLLKCTPESVALALRHCAQTGLDIGRTAHLVPFGQTCTFVPDYKGLIELAVGTHKVVSIRTRAVYEGEEFQYSETGAGPDIRHTPRFKGAGGVIIGAYAIADLRFGRFKVEFMNVDEIEDVRRKSKSWARGELTDWYARKTVVRRLCKTLPSSAKLQMALAHDDAEPDDIPDAEFAPVRDLPPAGGFALSTDYTEADAPKERVHGSQVKTHTITDEQIKRGSERAKEARLRDDGTGGYDLPTESAA